jgi:type VI secretion system protein VasI
VSDIERDVITDEAGATAVLLAERPGPDFVTDPPGLVLRCQRGRTDAYIEWRQFFGAASAVEVTVRIGNAEPVTQDWHVSADNTSTLLPGNTMRFIESLFGETRVAARTTPYGDDPVTAEFSITGVENAVANVREACGW